MKIQSCKRCGDKFKYITVLGSIGWSYKPLNCRNCGAKHRLKKLHIFIIITLLSLPIFFINQIYQLTLTRPLRILIFLIYLAYITVIIVIGPFFVEYNLESKIKRVDSIYGK